MTGASIRRICRLCGISVSVYRYQPTGRRDDGEVSRVLMELAQQYPAYGFAKLFHLVRNMGYRWNHKRIHRIYCALKPNFRRKGRKRLPNRHPSPLAVPVHENGCWSLDFMSDALSNGRRFRTLDEVRAITGEWMAEYNEVGHHEPLGNLPPRVFLMKNYAKNSNLRCA